MPPFLGRLLLVAVTMGALTSAQAQYELKRGSFNLLFSAAGTVPGGATPVTPQFRGVQVFSATAGPRAITGALSAQYRSQIYGNTGKALVLIRGQLGYGFAMGVPRFVLGEVIPIPTTKEMSSDVADASYWRSQPVERGETFSQPGSTVAGTPRKLMGFTVTAGGSGYTAAPTVTIAGGGGYGATATATVTSGVITGLTVTSAGFGYTSPPSVTFSSGAAVALPIMEELVPSESTLVGFTLGFGGVGYTSTPTVTLSGGGGSGATATATLTGGAVTALTITAAGTGFTAAPTVTFSASGASSTAVAVATMAAPAAASTYYSPHAERVFAHQAGRASVTWVTNAPQSVTVNGTTVQRFLFRQELFSVSSASAVPTRTIYWTEKTFTAPPVSVLAGTVEGVNPMYSVHVPQQVAEEYDPVGISQGSENGSISVTGPISLTMPVAGAELRTLWFQKIASVAELRAYNVEGRIMVEYLGALKPGSAATRVFLGADIVDVLRTMPTTNTETLLGEKIVARDAAGTRQPLDLNVEWLASPVQATTPDSLPYYSSVARGDGRLDYYAERENDSPDRIVFYWLASKQAAITYPTPGGPMMPSIYWPEVKNAYRQTWPTALSSYAHNIVAAAGSTATTGVQFATGSLPTVVFQDDPAQAEAKIDVNSQRFVVNTGTDGLNRTLLKFTNGSKVWYVRLSTQSVGRTGFEQTDGTAALTGTAIVGQRLVPPAGYEAAGYLESGTNHFPKAYIDPLAMGVTAASRGAIIPVNAMPGATTLTVWWLKAIPAPSADFDPFYLPAKKGVYTTVYPTVADTSADQIILASNAGSGDLGASEVAGQLYVQNNRTLAGFNPNEEHALMLNGRAYALRDDLNVLGTNGATYTSEPFVLIAYTSPTDGRPAMRTLKVRRELGTAGTAGAVVFNYPVIAGTPVPAPMPIPLLPLALDPVTKLPKNTEATLTGDGAQINAAATTAIKDFYSTFLFRDRKGYHWVYRGPHDTTKTPTFGMKFWYPMRADFYVPSLAFTAQPAVGTPLPYLRPLSGTTPQGDPVTGDALTITYAPRWPDNAPELRVGETLTLPKFGLPGVYGQTSAQVLYQQSLAGWSATAAATGSKPSVVLHDAFREKVIAFGPAAVLDALPSSLLTTSSGGKTYFQKLAPHLQPYVYFDPMRGTSGSLVFVGKFFDEAFGEDYVGLNVLSAADRKLLVDLVSINDTKATAWGQAVDALSTTVETFIEDPAKKGSYKPDTTLSVAVNAATSAAVSSSDTAVVNYAVTSTGQGSGWVTMIFGNGAAFTPVGEAITLQTFRVSKQIYPGEVKVITALNPLDEQVTLRHTADFAAKPEDYEFEWRYAPPQDGFAPPIYTYAMTSRLASTGWKQLQNPPSSRPTTAEMASALTVDLARQVTIKNASYSGTAPAPGIVLRSNTGVDYTAGVPSMNVFSADVSELTGFAVSINDVTALSYKVTGTTVSAVPSSGLVAVASGGLKLQFVIDDNFFRQGVNKVEIALYTTADVGAQSTVNFALHASAETDKVALAGSPWLLPNGVLSNIVTVGGSPTSPLGSPLLVMTDNYFTMRYKPKASVASVAGTAWSRWTDAKLVEGWVKRVLRGINPFNQRMSDLGNSAISTDVSLLTQAGKRWEGNVALSLASINDFGLIEIYETLLNRAKTISVDAGYDYGAANDALLLAAGYLNDLYVILGNEAYADAANPTILVDAGGAATEVSTSRFAFEGQAATVLEEELILLRGRDDSQAPGVNITPVYNRLVWNYTGGINSGEALYALNYNITDKTANGVVDAGDAQRMYPQGHGDAYGHYLTALTGYYKLLQNPNFTWSPRIEAVTVLGQPVAVDYYDERKFADAGSSLARTAEQVLSLTYRQAYKDDPAAGWGQLRDGKVNARTGITRNWGVDEWAARSLQGSYFNWVVGNALLPDKDTNPEHSGISVIDRRTVPSLQEIAIAGGSLQATLDGANAHLNPLGLSPGAIAFDISPNELKAGKSHYEQIYERALRAANNAKGAFDQAGKMARLLRTQDMSVDGYSAAIADQESAYVDKLVDIYGKPYSGEIGAGKVYAQGYDGPDTLEWFIVDRPAGLLVDLTTTVKATITVPKNFRQFTGFAIDDIKASYDGGDTQQREVVVQKNRFLQYADLWANGAGTLGTRPVTGTLQQALLDTHQAQGELLGLIARYESRKEVFKRRYDLYAEMVRVGDLAGATEASYLADIKAKRYLVANLNTSASSLALAGSFIGEIMSATSEYVPRFVGFSMDVLRPASAAIETVGVITKMVLETTASMLTIASERVAVDQEQKQTDMEQALAAINATYEDAQIVYEYELLYRELVQSHFEIAAAATKFQRASERVNKEIDNGSRLLAEREVFRQRAAAIVQGYRTRDVVFRTFRNEALEQYRSLFDLASRYTYLAAKSYDYETGLLGSTAGQAVLDAIVASRALGDLTGGVPQVTASSRGDAGLAGSMARIQTDWSVAKSRLGINNPDQNGTLFSLRRELFRLRDDPTITSDDTAWRQQLEQSIVPNLLADPDVAALCRNLQKPDGSAVPGIIIPFRTAVQHGQNFFGLPLADGDHAFSASNFSTKIYSVGVVLSGYVGMDPNLNGTAVSTVVFGSTPNALSATPYVYLIPTGTDFMRSPPLGDIEQIRGWKVADQALPLPFNLGATAFSTGSYVSANGTLNEQPWVLRKHQAFRPVSDPTFFYSTVPAEFTSSRLVGRSAWNSGWKIVIPAYTLYSNEQEGLNRLAASLSDIKLFLRTYSNAGN